MFYVKIHLDLYRKLQSVQKIEIYLINSMVYTVYLSCDVIKTDLNIK